MADFVAEVGDWKSAKGRDEGVKSCCLPCAAPFIAGDEWAPTLVNAVAPGPIWTLIIPSTLPEDSVSKFGKQLPMKRPSQPTELATAYFMLADPQSSYVSGVTVAVTGGGPFL